MPQSLTLQAIKRNLLTAGGQGAGCRCVDRVSYFVYWSRRRTQRKEKPQEPPKVMVDVPSHPSDPVEMRRLNFQTPGEYHSFSISSITDIVISNTKTPLGYLILYDLVVVKNVLKN